MFPELFPTYITKNHSCYVYPTPPIACLPISTLPTVFKTLICGLVRTVLKLPALPVSLTYTSKYPNLL